MSHHCDKGYTGLFHVITVRDLSKFKAKHERNFTLVEIYINSKYSPYGIHLSCRNRIETIIKVYTFGIMMTSKLSKPTGAVWRALSSTIVKYQDIQVATLSTLPGILQRDSSRGAPFIPASINLPNSYSGQIQTAQGREHEFSKNRARDTVDMQNSEVEQAMANVKFNIHDPTVAEDSHPDYYDDGCNISLHSVMQSTVPEPYSRSPTHLNMPGSGILQRQRFESSRRVDIRDHEINVDCKRKYHTSSLRLIPQASSYVSKEDFQPPAAQGVQGDDCVTFKLWLENCHRYNLNCDEDLQGIQSGRKTLSQVFAEQDELIRKIAADRHFSTSSQQEGNTTTSEVGRSDGSSSGPPPLPDGSNMSQKDKFKRAIKEYGTTVIVFHVGISLISLGGFYALVSSGIDVVGLLQKAGIAEEFLKSKAVSGASTFVVAYAVHKCFAPVRMATTVACTPLIVRYLRQVGFLKPPKPSS